MQFDQESVTFLTSFKRLYLVSLGSFKCLGTISQVSQVLDQMYKAAVLVIEAYLSQLIVIGT